MRQAIHSLRHRRLLHYLEQDDPVIALLEYLENIARKGNAVPPLYLDLRRLLDQHQAEYRSELLPVMQTVPAAASDLGLPQRAPKTAPRPEVGKASPTPPLRKAING
jgi:hypothetical protein